MKRKIKKILSYLPAFVSDYFEWLFSDASENQIRIAKLKKNKFSSYTQLKKHQKKLKRFFAGIFLAAFFLLVGMVATPVLFPKQPEPELYIPNGKGDILLGNISKNQATVIFKTLDGANGNKPLATSAIVEVYQDQQYSKLELRTVEDEYAVTHIIPINYLQEGKFYYIRIIARDAANPAHTKAISSWGDGNDPISVYTAGEFIANCAPASDVQKLVEKNEKSSVPITKPIESTQDFENVQDVRLVDDSALQILRVMNENHLQPKNKVQTIISWNTNRPASTVLIYGEGNSKEKTEIITDDRMQTRHASVLTTLKAGTTYYFHAKAMDEKGNVTLSEEYSLRTPKPQSTVTEKIADSFLSIFKQVKPR